MVLYFGKRLAVGRTFSTKYVYRVFGSFESKEAEQTQGTKKTQLA
jgi:hypothetical protein